MNISIAVLPKCPKCDNQMVPISTEVRGRGYHTALGGEYVDGGVSFLPFGYWKCTNNECKHIVQ